VWLLWGFADLAQPVYRVKDEPRPTCAIVHACSRVASRNGAAGYKLMRSSHATSDIDAGPANDKAPKQTERRGRNSTTERSFGPRSSSLPPCSKLSRRGLETSKCALWPERRPTLTASARAGVRNLRSGRKKACGAVEQKKAQKQRKKGLDSAPAHIIPIAPAAPPVPNFPRLRALALFGRRPPQRVEASVMPASKNLHNNGSN
jgi:hypothetical protein